MKYGSMTKDDRIKYTNIMEIKLIFEFFFSFFGFKSMFLERLSNKFFYKKKKDTEKGLIFGDLVMVATLTKELI